MEDVTERVRAAAAGDRAAVREVLDAIEDDVHRLALRTLGHPADAARPAPPAHVFAFDEIVEAHRLMESGRALGKIVVVVSG
jgi:hypothetical protein